MASVSHEEFNDDDNVFLSTSTKDVCSTFLDTDCTYTLPEFACNILDKTAAFTLQVKNVAPDSVVIDRQSLLVHVKFISIGAGFFPQHYSFCIRFPEECGAITDVQPDVWDNNLILQIDLLKVDFGSYEAGLEPTKLKVYTNDARVRDAIPTKKADENDADEVISVDVSSVSENELKIQINSKKKSEHDTKSKTKVKRKNKKTRSLSESNCDDLREEEQEAAAAAARNAKKSENVKDQSAKSTTDSICIEKSPQKMRTYSESSNDEQVVPKCIKGILKRRSSFNRSISESSVDDHFYSCSMDLGVGSIPEEDSERMSESCKKTVRFDNNIRKQLYR